jgi:hypothetical protein
MAQRQHPRLGGAGGLYLLDFLDGTGLSREADLGQPCE